jgi:hypothetical protein
MENPMFRSLISRLKPRAKAGRPRRYGLPRRTFLEPAECLEVRCLPAAMLTIGDVTIVEGNSGTVNARVTIALTEPHGNSVMVDYATADGTANAGSDYDAVSGRLTSRKNEMSKTILVPIRGDRLVEPDEFFSVRLSNSKGAKIADGTGIVTIVDDEPRVSIGDAYQDYYGTSITFTVSLAVPSDEEVTVNFATVDGSAVAGLDYVAQSGTLTFEPGETTQTITVALIDGSNDSADKYLSVQLSSPSSNALLSNTSAVGYWYYDYGYYDYGYYDYGYYGYYY